MASARCKNAVSQIRGAQNSAPIGEFGQCISAIDVGVLGLLDPFALQIQSKKLRAGVAYSVEFDISIRCNTSCLVRDTIGFFYTTVRSQVEPNRIACNTCGQLALESTLLANEGMCMACTRAAADQSLSQLHDDLSIKFGVCYISNPLMLPRNKNTSYRESVMTSSRGIAEAFDEMKLTNSCLVERYNLNPEHFYVAAADLTETGSTFARKSFNKWLARTDRWKPESRTIERYKESLVKEFQVFQRAQTV